MQVDLFSVITWGGGFLLSFLSLIGVKEWRDGIKRERIYERLDEIKKKIHVDFVRKDLFELSQRQQDVQMTALKSEIDEIKVKVELIPTILSDIKLLLKKADL